MPNDMKHKNGALVQHSDKWSEANRRKNSHNAGQGSRGSRNQGTGEAGKANTVASGGMDTSNMSQHEKLKYFNSLGLLNPTQKKQLQDMDAAASAPKEQPQQAPKAAPVGNPVKELSDNLGRIFAQKPNLIQGIVKELQAVPKEELKSKAQAVLDAMKGNRSTEPTEVFSTIMRALQAKPQAAPAQEAPKMNSAQDMSDLFGKVGAEGKNNAQQVKNVQAKIMDRLGDNQDKTKRAFDALNKALESYVPGEKDKFQTIMNAVFGEMKKYEAEHGEKVSPDGYMIRKDEEGAVDQKDAPKEQEDLPDTVDMDGYISRPDEYDFGSDKEGYEYAMDIYRFLAKNYDYANKYVDQFVSAWDNYKDKGYDFPAEAAFFELGKLLQKDGVEIGSKEDTSSLDAELAKDRQMTPGSKAELNKLLSWIVDIGKNAGKDNKSINRSISWINNKIDNNGRKLQKAWSDLVNGADEIDIDSPEAYEYAMTTLDNSFQDYENGNLTASEQDIMRSHGK